VGFDEEIPSYERDIDNSIEKTEPGLSPSHDYRKNEGFDMFISLDKERRQGYKKNLGQALTVSIYHND
jgi:hypothetical protein